MMKPKSIKLRQIKKTRMLFTGSILIMISFTCLVGAKNRPEETTRYALLIGGGTTEQDNYESYYENIEYAADTLRKLGYRDENITVLFYGGKSQTRPSVDFNATKNNIGIELKRLAEIINADDSLLIFRCGHGMIELIFEEYGILSGDEKVPTNVPVNVVGTAAVMNFPDGPLNYLEFRDMLGNINAAQIIVILSQCFSGQFADMCATLDNTVVITESDVTELSFFCKRKTKRWAHDVWPFVKCFFDGLLDSDRLGGKQTVHAAFQYMLGCNPYIEGMSIKADRPLLKETPRIQYGGGLRKGAVYIDK
jgi:hypothetical protein